MPLPPFGPDGTLPPGDYELTLANLRKSMLVLGPAGSKSISSWDAGWRLTLVNHLEILVDQLYQVGISQIFINGSFVEDKAHPNDIDGYFHCSLKDLASGNLAARLNVLDPWAAWGWAPESRRPYQGYPKLQLPMWHRYRVELYPHFGQPSSGIVDRFGNELDFPAAFRISRRDDKAKGIIKIGAPS